MNFKIGKNRDSYTELQRINHAVAASYVVLAVALTVLGLWAYGIVGEKPLRPVCAIFYYILLWGPTLIYATHFFILGNTLKYRNHLYACFFVFYFYTITTSTHALAPLLAIPFMILTIAYGKLTFSLSTSVMISILAMLNILIEVFQGRDRDYIYLKIYGLLVILAATILLNVTSYMIEMVTLSRQEALAAERNRLRKLASVGMKRIFEYNLKTDNFMTARSDDGHYGQERHIDGFSTIAKQYRYVLLADWPVLDAFMEDCRKGTDVIDCEMRLRNKNADYRWYRLKARSIKDADGKPDKVIGVMENIDEIKRMEIRQADDNMRDPLTKLYRRHYAEELISDYIKSQADSENGDYAALLNLDIDNFNILNDRMGKAFGDEILKNIASDMDSIFYPTDILGRVGGDEFVILMKNIKSIPDIEKKVREIQKVINRTYVGENLSFGSTVGIGIAVYPTDGEDYDTLFSKAEKALFNAKSVGMNCFRFYDPTKEAVYATYPIEEKHLQRREEEAIEAAMPHSNNSLIELAFKLIDESKDTDSAINLLIRQVARQMNLDAIRIKSRAGKEFRMVNSYMCTSSPEIEFADDDVEFSMEQWSDMMDEYHGQNGLVVYNRLDDVENGMTRSFMLANGAKSYVGAAFYDKGEFAGIIDFMDMNDDRVWSADELTDIRAVANVVSSYLLKMKAYEDASDTVERLTGYDVVTGLMKYEKYLSMVAEYIENAPHGKYAMVYLDFANFKYINDTYGYEAGDKVLRELAEECMSYTDFYIYGSRVFSDNIVTFFRTSDRSDEDLIQMFTRAAKRFSDKIAREYNGTKINADIGICRFNIDGNPVPIKNIISNANMARKRAKQPEMPAVIIYDDAMGDELKTELGYANDMEGAFRNHEFVVYMQPKVNLQNNHIEGAEALIRWRKPDGTIIYPNDFIPVFEKNKSITLLDYYVYDEVCKYIRNRLDSGKKVVRVSVNVSRVHLYSIDDIVSYVRSLLDKYEIPPKYLEFELTETVFTDRVDDTIVLMSRLRELGVLVSMDDFGSGYSSLNVLTKMPLDVVKLDKEFLDDFDTDPDEKLLIPSIIDMAKKLNLKVVCEGVETGEQMSFLRDVGCDYAQGYFYSKPIPIEQFNELLEV